MPIAYLGLGSNLGNRSANIVMALERLDAGPARILRVSSLYETSPVGVTAESVPDYLNCAAEVETSLPAEALLRYAKSVERDVGRVESFRWGPRAIDIDILLYDAVTMDSENLTIPHARLHERKFVLIPLLELDSDLTLPDGRRILDLAESRELAGQSIHKLDAAMHRGAAAME